MTPIETSLIAFRDTRLINWSCALQSAISEIEVDYIDLDGITYLSVPNHKNRPKYEFGTMTSFAYKVDIFPKYLCLRSRLLGATKKSLSQQLVWKRCLATQLLLFTPMTQDILICMANLFNTHLLIAKFPSLPVTPERVLISHDFPDDVLVDMNFGTGAVKITPAHDPNDNACGKRKNLDSIIIFTGDGKIADNCGQFSGMPNS